MKYVIDIIDTQTNNRVLVDELTEARSPKIVYNGSDDKIAFIVPSELRFNMLVDDKVDGKFLHLYTADEQRYKGVLKSVDENNAEQVVWRGFLMPEFFSEPYVNSNFFVDFVLTDGVGFLNNSYLQKEFYSTKNTLAYILASVLKLLGNSENFYYAPAIVNTLKSDLYLSAYELDCKCYKDSNGYKDAYFILKALLETLACKFFQYNGAWYLIGMNRFGVGAIDFETYTLEGEYAGVTTFTRPVKPVFFRDSATVSMLPVFKEVSVDFKNPNDGNVLEEDICKPFFDYTKDGVIQVRYVTVGPGSDVVLGLSAYDKYWGGVVFAQGSNFDASAYANDLITKGQVDEPFFLTIAGTTTTNDGITINKAIPVKGDVTNTRKAGIKIKARAYFAPNTGDLKAAFDNEEFKNKFIYTLRLNGNVIATNEANYTGINRGDFDIKLGEYFNILESAGFLDLDLDFQRGVALQEDGYLSLHIASLQNGITPTLNRIVFKELSIFMIDDLIPTVKLRRSVNASLHKTFDLEHDFSRSENSLSSIVISDDYNFVPPNIQYPAIEYKIPVLNYWIKEVKDPFPGNAWDYKLARFGLTKDDFESLKTNPVYFKRAGSSVLERVTNFELVEDFGLFFQMRYGGLYGSETPPFTADDELWVKNSLRSVSLLYPFLMKEFYKPFGSDFNGLEYKEAYAMIMHELYNKPRFKVEGTVLGVVSFLDVLQFDYVNKKEYQVNSLTVDLVEGESTVMIAEQAVEKVLDYAS